MVGKAPFTLPDSVLRRLASTPPNGTNLQSGQLGGAGMSLTVSAEGVPNDMCTAAYYLQLFAQGSALGQLKAKGVNIDDPSVYQSYAYYSYYISSLTQLGLNVTSASGNSVKQSTYKGSLDIGDLLMDILSVYIPAAELADMTALFKLLSTTSDPKITNFLNFWWDNTSYSTTESSLALGPLVIGDSGLPQFTIVYYNFNYSVTQWRSLFVELQNASLNVNSSAITGEFDMDTYNSTVYPVIYPVIQSSIQKYVASTPFSLG